MTSSVYDPLGLVAPVVLTAKKLLQDLCKKNIGWDTQSVMKMVRDGRSGRGQLPSLSRISLGRCIKPLYFGDLKFAELHNFADASKIAYGAVSYLRMVDVKDRIHCTFLIWKPRLAHLKPMTVPRLELSAAVLAVQLDKSVREDWTFRLHNQHIGQTPPACCSTSEISRRDFTRLLQTDSQLFTRTQPPTSGDT